MEYSDFCKPNPVVLYGYGNFFHEVAPKLLDMKINISGVIDINKTGIAKINDVEIPIYNIDEAANKFTTNVFVIITLKNISLVKEVKTNLIKHGYIKDNIFDINQIMWITVHSEKSFCPFLGRDITISNNNVSTCCIPSAYKLAITYYFFDEDNEDNIVNTLLKQYQFYRTESFNGRVPLFCIDCPILSDDQSVWGNTIDNLNFNVHTYCNADCVYCNAEGILKIRNEKTLINYEERCKIISKILLEVKSNKTFNEKSRLTLVGGEITVNANKKLLYDMVNHIPHNPILIYTNGFIYDEEIANILTTNSNAQIMCDIDAGTRITYIKVKGFDKFNIVRNNLKKYVNSGTVILKYIIKPGWNDTNEDILGTIDLLKFLNIDVLLISPDFKYVSLNKKEIKREIVFSASKFKIMLEKSNFKCVVLDVYWQRQYITEINRTVNELKSADFTL